LNLNIHYASNLDLFSLFFIFASIYCTVTFGCISHFDMQPKVTVFQVPRSESSWVQKFQGAKVAGSKSSKERKFLGAKVPGSESSTPGIFAPRSEWFWERKVHNSQSVTPITADVLARFYWAVPGRV